MLLNIPVTESTVFNTIVIVILVSVIYLIATDTRDKYRQCERFGDDVVDLSSQGELISTYLRQNFNAASMLNTVQKLNEQQPFGQMFNITSQHLTNANILQQKVDNARKGTIVLTISKKSNKTRFYANSYKIYDLCIHKSIYTTSETIYICS